MQVKPVSAVIYGSRTKNNGFFRLSIYEENHETFIKNIYISFVAKLIGKQNKLHTGCFFLENELSTKKTQQFILIISLKSQ